MSYNYDESKETLIPITQLADNLGYKPKKKESVEKTEGLENFMEPNE